MTNDIETGDKILSEDVQRWQKLADSLADMFARDDMDETEYLFAELQREIGGWLLAIAKSKLPEEDAHEVVSDVYLNLYDHLRAGQPIHQIRAFLRRLVKCRIVDILRKGKEEACDPESEVLVSGSALTNEGEDVFAESDFRMDCQNLKNVLLEVLPTPEKEVLFLRHYYGFSVEETAERLELTPDIVKKRTKKAIELAAQIADEQGMKL